MNAKVSTATWSHGQGKEPWSGEGAGEGTLGNTDAETEVGTAGKGTVGGFQIVSGWTFEYGIHFHQIFCHVVSSAVVW